MTDINNRPELKEEGKDLSSYDELYIGFPIWWYTAPHIINSFIEANDMEGKKITLFSTSGGSGIEKAVKDLKSNYPQLNIVGGKSVNGSVAGIDKL